MKVEKEEFPITVMMELKSFFSLLSTYMPPGPLRENDQFRAWMVENSKEMSEKYADYILMALPSPRHEWYRNNDYA
jgi:hypothetical protein